MGGSGQGVANGPGAGPGRLENHVGRADLEFWTGPGRLENHVGRAGPT